MAAALDMAAGRDRHMRRFVACAVGLGSTAALGFLAVAPTAQASQYQLGWRVTWTGPRDGALQAVTAPARNAAWAIGDVYGHHGHSFLVRWNGARWRTSAMPVRGYTATNIGSSSPRNVWIFGFAGTGGREESLRFNGRRWSAVAGPPLTGVLRGEAVLGPANVWVGGTTSNNRQVVFHWNGRGWSTFTAAASPARTAVRKLTAV